MLNSIHVFRSTLDHDKMTQNKWIKPHPRRLGENFSFSIMHNAPKFHYEIQYQFDSNLYEYEEKVVPKPLLAFINP